jgi:phage N-6-adenine-methyltransferase
MNSIFTSSKSNSWTTPDWLYKQLDDEFHFQLDAAATIENAKCPVFFSYIDASRNALTQQWYNLYEGDGITRITSIFCNPPYNKLDEWIEQGWGASQLGCTVVFVLPTTKTDQPFWHNRVLKDATDIRFIKGRVKFGGSKSAAPFPSVVVVFKPKSIDWKLSSMKQEKK